MNFPFHEQPDTAAIICCHIIDRKEPILYVSHDEDDGMWQFLCGDEHSLSDAGVVSPKEVFLSDKTIGVLAELPRGYFATRKNSSDDWHIGKK